MANEAILSEDGVEKESSSYHDISNDEINGGGVVAQDSEEEDNDNENMDPNHVEEETTSDHQRLLRRIEEDYRMALEEVEDDEFVRALEAGEIFDGEVFERDWGDEPIQSFETDVLEMIHNAPGDIKLQMLEIIYLNPGGVQGQRVLRAVARYYQFYEVEYEERKGPDNLLHVFRQALSWVTLYPHRV